MVSPDGLTLLVCGGRDYPNRANVFRVLDRIHAKQPIACIYSGACTAKGADGEMRGADRWAIEWAIAREVNFRGFPAKWERHGRPAGHLRNLEMLQRMPSANSGVLAFPGGAGTNDMCRLAHGHGLRVRTADDDGNLKDWSTNAHDPARR